MNNYGTAKIVAQSHRREIAQLGDAIDRLEHERNRLRLKAEVEMFTLQRRIDSLYVEFDRMTALDDLNYGTPSP